MYKVITIFVTRTKQYLRSVNNAAKYYEVQVCTFVMIRMSLRKSPDEDIDLRVRMVRVEKRILRLGNID